MSTIDKQRIAAVKKLEQLGYTFAAGDWMHPTNDATPVPAITDALHALLVKRADNLEGCSEGSERSDAAAYGGMAKLIKAFGLTNADVERWQLAGVPRYHYLGLYLDLQVRGYRATPALFGASSWKDLTGVRRHE